MRRLFCLIIEEICDECLNEGPMLPIDECVKLRNDNMFSGNLAIY